MKALELLFNEKYENKFTKTIDRELFGNSYEKLERAYSKHDNLVNLSNLISYYLFF